MSSPLRTIPEAAPSLPSAQKDDSRPASTSPNPSPAANTPTPANPPPAKALEPAAASAEEKKLSPKELKEKKKAEKAARRAQTKVVPPQAVVKQQQAQQQQKKQPQGGKKGAEGVVKTIYVSGQEKPGAKGNEVVKEVVAEICTDSAKDRGLVGLLRDLEHGQTGKKKLPVFGIDKAHPDVHAAILTLGMQINKRVIAGSSARCLGFLLAIKRVIEDYKTPEGSALNRHLPGAYLSHQINYITSARPMATAMGNAIRWLKEEISKISPDFTDEMAKKTLVEKIEGFIHEKVTAADEMIVKTACDRYIKDGDVILTFSKSSVVEKILLEANKRGKRFRVIVVDNRPLLEGKNLLAALVNAGVECSYIHLYALSYSMKEATKVFLGAHAVMANGALYSRSGTAVTATAAKNAGVPVLVCCESIKFSDKINIDGIVNNEMGKFLQFIDCFSG